MRIKDPSTVMVNDRQNREDESKDPYEMKLIYMTWINLWCATFKY